MNLIFHNHSKPQRISQMRYGKDMECLIARLVGRGLTHVQAQRLVRDVLLITDQANLGFETILQKLGHLGWDKDVMDRFSFEQVMLLCAEG